MVYAQRPQALRGHIFEGVVIGLELPDDDVPAVSSGHLTARAEAGPDISPDVAARARDPTRRRSVPSGEVIALAHPVPSGRVTRGRWVGSVAGAPIARGRASESGRLAAMARLRPLPVGGHALTGLLVRLVEILVVAGCGHGRAGDRPWTPWSRQLPSLAVQSSQEISRICELSLSMRQM